jgi:proline dehydrogenase
MTKISFQNTEVAFRRMSNSDLKRASFLFNLIGAKWLVESGKKITQLAFALHLPIKGIIRATLFKQFVGGESISDCEKTIHSLSSNHVGTILDYSVEGKQEEKSFDETCDEIIRTIHKASTDERIPFSVFKITGIARHQLLEKKSSGDLFNQDEKNEWSRVIERVNRICSCGVAKKVPVLIDAEESWIQPAIDELTEQMMQSYNRGCVWIYHTLQMYRHDRLAYLHELHKKASADGYLLGFKIVRGAYMEKERLRATELNYTDPIQPNKDATDLDYNEALRYCITNINDIALCAGSHNEESAQLLLRLMEEKQIDNNHPHIYFAQLLGMSDHISFNLSDQHYNVAKYVPYGPVKEVLPYLIRRAEENTSVKGQTGRELQLIRAELKRRKKIIRNL